MRHQQLFIASFVTMLFSFSVSAQNENNRSSQSYQSYQTYETEANWSEESATAKRSAPYDILDTNYIPKRRMDQHREFLNHEYDFPAKPRNMWEIGIGAGLYNYTADVPSLLLWERGGYGFHAHVRKAWGYSFSTRLQYIFGVAKGVQWMQSENYRWNPAWTDNGYVPARTVKQLPNPDITYPAKDVINYNYRSRAHQLNVDFMFNTNNIRFHKARTGLSFYAFLGVGGFLFNTKINALDENGQRYNFPSINGQDDGIAQVHGNRRQIKRSLLDNMDNTYETDAENERAKRRPGIFGENTIDFCYSLGLGMQFKLSNNINLSIEDRITIPHEEDLLDGQRWAEQNYGDPVFSQNNDMVNYLSLGINFNIGNARRSVEPLYWLNPLVYSYGRDMSLKDMDKDGVADQFDICPGTPEGIPVDVNGCPMDTDGDGVPDYRDKQLITPTECQPVDEDGIGKCPCPDCMTTAGPCTDIGSGSFVFSANSTRIEPHNQSKLASLATLLKANPTCKIVITGSGNTSKIAEQRSWDRVDAIITYMSERFGIDRNRFIFQYGQPGESNVVTYRTAMPGEDGLSNVPPPFPNLRSN